MVVDLWDGFVFADDFVVLHVVDLLGMLAKSVVVDVVLPVGACAHHGEQSDGVVVVARVLGSVGYVGLPSDFVDAGA